MLVAFLGDLLMSLVLLLPSLLLLLPGVSV
jgi:hypothetical protein